MLVFFYSQASYNIIENKWEWPETIGQPPSPRASSAGKVKRLILCNIIALNSRLFTFSFAGFLCDSRFYIFGGRLKDTRMNDLCVTHTFRIFMV